MDNSEKLKEFVRKFGKQAIVVSIDIKNDFHKKLYSNSGFRKQLDLDSFIEIIKQKECGEILLNDIDREGTWF